MKVQHKESTVGILELINKTNCFTKLKTDTGNNSLSVPIKVSSYCELNLIVSSLLKTSIALLKNDDFSESKIDIMILLEIAQQLLPEDEMELLDELYKLV